MARSLTLVPSIATSFTLPSTPMSHTSFTKPSVLCPEAAKQARRSASLPRNRCSTVSGGKISARVSDDAARGVGCFVASRPPPQDAMLATNARAAAPRLVPRSLALLSLVLLLNGIVLEVPAVSHSNRTLEERSCHAGTRPPRRVSKSAKYCDTASFRLATNEENFTTLTKPAQR